MYGSPLHNTCVLRKAVLVGMLQVSKSFFLIRPEKKAFMVDLQKYLNPRAS